jgi:hypothetical protein
MQYTTLPALLEGSENWTIKLHKRSKNNNSSKDEIYEKNRRVHLNRLLTNTELAATYKQNPPL